MNRTYIYTLITIFVLGLIWYGIEKSPNVPDDPFLKQVHEARELGLDWLSHNVTDKGLFIYSINAETGEVPDRNNAIRQLMGSRILAEEAHDSRRMRVLHKDNLDFILEYWYREQEGDGYVLLYDKSKLGANAMLLRTLVYSPFFDEYEDGAEALANGILSLQHEDGSFDPWYVEPDYAYDRDRLLTFYSGEALLALVEYYERTQDEELLEAIELSADFYVNAYAINLSDNYYPAYVPWHTLFLNKLYTITEDRKYTTAIFIMNDKLLEIQDTTEFIGRFYNPQTPEYGSPHSSSDGVYTEGLVYAYEVAVMVGDTERAERYKEAIVLGIENLLTLQYQDHERNLFIHPDRYVGGIKVRHDSAWIRVDTVQHALDGFTKILEVF